MNIGAPKTFTWLAVPAASCSVEQAPHEGEGDEKCHPQAECAKALTVIVFLVSLSLLVEAAELEPKPAELKLSVMPCRARAERREYV